MERHTGTPRRHFQSNDAFDRWTESYPAHLVRESFENRVLYYFAYGLFSQAIRRTQGKIGTPFVMSDIWTPRLTTIFTVRSR
jgi:hypothetical protein